MMHTDQGRVQIKRKNRRRLPRQRPPTIEARSYFDELRALLRVMREITMSAINRELPGILAELPRRGDSHYDAIGDRISRLFDGVRISFAERVSKEKLNEAVRKAGRRVSQRQKGQLDRQIKVATGIDPFSPEIGVGEHINAFVSENVSLIRTIPEKFFSEIEQTIIRGARVGEGAERVGKRIEKRYGVAESRAKMIARDQTAKLFGEVNELRQRELGIDEYTWRTSGDERVRPGHAKLDNKVQKWSKPPIVDKGTGRRAHPGGDFQCRCVAEPVINES